MSYLLFVDESGHDRQHSPYEVLAGAVVHDTQLWPLVTQIRSAKPIFFGTAALSVRELKARKILNRQTYRVATRAAAIPQPERAELAATALLDGAHARWDEITALGQAKIEYCSFVLDCCTAAGVKLFASIVEPDARYPAGNMLRKDYAYLFERFFYFINEQDEHERGLVIFDEIERSKAHLLVDQMAAYFEDTRTGRERAARILPEPLFVHSDRSTLIQVADLAAYVIAWNVRIGNSNRPHRPELDLLGKKVLALRHKAIVGRRGFADGFVVWSFAHIDDLRPRSEIDAEEQFAERFGTALDEHLTRLEARGE